MSSFRLTFWTPPIVRWGQATYGDFFNGDDWSIIPRYTHGALIYTRNACKVDGGGELWHFQKATIASLQFSWNCPHHIEGLKIRRFEIEKVALSMHQPCFCSLERACTQSATFASFSLLICHILWWRYFWRIRSHTDPDLEPFRSHDCRPSRWFYALEPSYGCMGRWQSCLSWKITYISLIMVDAARIAADRGRIFPLNWTHRCRFWLNADTFKRSLGPIVYLHIWGRWKLLGGIEIGSGSHDLGWHVISKRIRLEMERRRASHVEVLPFVPCIQTREQDHAVASQYCISFDFWWVSSDCCEEWVWFRWCGPFRMGPSARLQGGNLADGGWW